MSSATLELSQQLIERPSVTPEDAGCQALLADRLQQIGFHVEHLRFGEVDNLWARRGASHPLFVFAGHTDVVPTGPENQWRTPPFRPVIDNGILYGRGACDMKSSLAAMVCACESFVAKHPEHDGSIAFLLTSDEEGPAVDGTARVIEWLQQRGETIDWCLIGEPSSSETVGDTLKNGRRGSIGASLTIHGTQGHIAYPQLADNPIHRALPVLQDLVAEQWDNGNEFFPPTSFQISNIRAGTGATNVIPGCLQLQFNLRFSTEITHEDIRRRIEAILNRHAIEYDIDWQFSGAPFLTPKGELIDAVRAVVAKARAFEIQLSTSGGTSDGRFIAPTGAQVVELGPVNASIHKINEHIDIAELDMLTEMYTDILERLLARTR